MLAAGLDLSKQLNLVELIVAIGVANAIDTVGPAALVDRDVEAVEGVEQSVRFADVEIDLLSFDSFAARLRQRDAMERAILVAHDQAAFRIEAHRDPRAFG